MREKFLKANGKGWFKRAPLVGQGLQERLQGTAVFAFFRGLTSVYLVYLCFRKGDLNFLASTSCHSWASNSHFSLKKKLSTHGFQSLFYCFQLSLTEITVVCFWVLLVFDSEIIRITNPNWIVKFAPRGRGYFPFLSLKIVLWIRDKQLLPIDGSSSYFALNNQFQVAVEFETHYKFQILLS